MTINIPSDKEVFLEPGGRVSRVWYRFLMDFVTTINTVVVVQTNTIDESGFNPLSLDSDADDLALEPRPPEQPVSADEPYLPSIIVPDTSLEEAQMNAGTVIALCESVLQNYGLIT